MPFRINIQMRFDLDFFGWDYYYYIMIELRKSKEFVSYLMLVVLLSMFVAPVSLHAQRARTVTTTNAVTTTTNSRVATISKK